jgi:CubicO group peptidase (beta-lactamase class C family)
MKTFTLILLIFIPILLSGLSNPATKANTDTDPVNEWIQAKMQEFDIPGLSLVVIKDGKIIRHNSYGLASIEFDVPVSNETVFQIASTTKGFTGVGIMMLVEEGKLSLSDRIGDVLPGIPSSWKDVTVRQIMTHTSGLPRILETPGTMTGKEEIPGESFKDAVNWLSRKPNEFSPGEKWVYNQTGYMLAKWIIELKSGKSWEEFAKERIFVPSGMSSTSFGGLRDIVMKRATIYEGHPKKGKRQFDKLIVDPRITTAAGINTTSGDMAKWLIALEKEKLLKKSFLDVLWTPIKLKNGEFFKMPVGDMKLKYGLGWMIIEFPSGHRAVGGEGGSYNAFLYFPEQDLAVVVLTNRMESHDLRLVIGIARQYIPELKTEKSRQ